MENSMMKVPETYTSQVFHLYGLKGISDRTVDRHMGLYKGYANATNTLKKHRFDLVKAGREDDKKDLSDG